MKLLGASRLSWLAASVALWACPAGVMAQGVWGGSSPAFQSEIDRQEQEREARRAEIRRSSGPTSYPAYMEGGGKPDVAPEEPPVAYLEQNEAPGTIIVDTSGRKLYYVLQGKKAYVYPISVGRDGFTWTGTERVSRIAAWPSWTPPSSMHQRQKGLPITVSGGLINPLGARALYLGSSIYRIHGTNNDRAIGRASSSGCFRMMNQHVVHLATLARVGTPVRVVASYAGASTSAPVSALCSGFGATAEAPPAKSKKK